ncbi:hypothetical protein DVK00_02800 [Haloarcula sp. Atlit-47R]|uniref:hypothetical protein n=1 Tax=Haloarcula sp. Atlit-47R TaxID=2282132 RepID=UPI000EF17FB4|nr:hypothetical protein [Haloarcula sp. Atlit-47R]RLM47453.1 hypothetical protein DVK00_02800 [Haloarcula sp. Atlit-47R]
MSEDDPTTGSSDPDDNVTNTTATRWDYTNDLLAFILILGSGIILGLDAIGHATVPEYVWGAWVAALFIGAAWAFGSKAVESYRKLRGGGG